MSLRFTPQAVADAKRVQGPSSGTLYEQGDLEVPVHRVLLPKTRHHVYYAMDGNDVVVLSVWGTPRGHGPKL